MRKTAHPTNFLDFYGLDYFRAILHLRKNRLKPRIFLEATNEHHNRASKAAQPGGGGKDVARLDT